MNKYFCDHCTMEIGRIEKDNLVTITWPSNSTSDKRHLCDVCIEKMKTWVYEGFALMK